MEKITQTVGINVNNNIVTILKGSVISLITTIILLFILSAVLTYTNISENIISPVIIVITAISILFGSQITTRKIKKNGILNGGIIGVIYIITLYLLSSIISGNFAVNTYSIVMIITSMVAGMFGGVIGVNIK